jgi:hypothetical protein
MYLFLSASLKTNEKFPLHLTSHYNRTLNGFITAAVLIGHSFCLNFHAPRSSPTKKKVDMWYKNLIGFSLEKLIKSFD